MIIDFRDIVKEQKQLNAQIFANHGITNEKQKFNELKLALLVELGELANEVKSFKYWSNKSRSENEIILDEYADGIHFIASFCIMFNVVPVFSIKNDLPILEKEEITKKFNKLYKKFSSIKLKSKKNDNKTLIKKWFKKYIKLAYYLGFNEQDIRNSYFKKHEVNIQRQNTNY